MINSIKKLKPIKIKDLIRRISYKKKNSVFYKKSPKDTFTSIYQTNHWGGKESLSGRGSDQAQTETIIEELNSLLSSLNIQSILDLPCGDFKWMKHVDLKDIQYLGADIVDELIIKNKNTFSKKNLDFKVIDLINDPLPTYDLILCRDCFVHLSYSDLYKSINNIKNSGCEYLLTTSFIDRDFNYDICTGDWRPLNLALKPFQFPEPIAIINENCSENNGEYLDKSLCLYRIKDIEIIPKLFDIK